MFGTARYDWLVLLSAMTLVILSRSVTVADMPAFTVHDTAQPKGRGFGQTSAVDVDRDGDLDFIVGTQSGRLFWLENQGKTSWPLHHIGGDVKSDVGGVAIDVDGDGWIDQISGGTWYRNPGDPASAVAWERFENGAISTHDNLAHDMNGDGRLDLVSLDDSVGVRWYEISRDPKKRWIENKIAGVTDPPCHGGVAAGDVDGDGDADIFRVDRWYENANGQGTLWIERRVFEFGKIGPWGIQTRAEFVDIDRDGDLDLIQAEGDVYDGRVACFVNLNGDGKSWRMDLIRAPGHHQDFHSLCVADFDGDGDADVFSGGGPLTQGEHVWFIWENRDGKGTEWKEHRVQTGLRTHESVAADVDADGDIDILTKPWNENRHVFFENLRIVK